MDAVKNRYFLSAIPVVQQVLGAVIVGVNIKRLAVDVKRATTNIFEDISYKFKQKDSNCGYIIKPDPLKTKFLKHITNLVEGILISTPAVGTLYSLGMAYMASPQPEKSCDDNDGFTSEDLSRMYL